MKKMKGNNPVLSLLKKQVYVVLAFVFVLCINPLRTFSQEIKVMTYNIYHGEQNYDAGKSNLQQVADVINQYQPDLVALQEVDSMTVRSAKLNDGVKKDLVRELAKMTGMHGYFAKAIDYSEGGYGEGILSRFPAQPHGYKLSNPEGGEGRALLTVGYTFSNGQKIIFAGTHLCHQYAKNRIAQAHEIGKILQEAGLPVILGGDFNLEQDSEPYSILDKDFIDAAREKGKPENTIPFDKPTERIDYIFVSKGYKWKIKNVKVIPNNASDHMPVLVTLELK